MAQPGGAALVRHARRLADRLRAPWTAIHVETRATARRRDRARSRRRSPAACERARRRGGDDAGRRTSPTALSTMRRRIISPISSSRRPAIPWLKFLRGSTAQKLIRTPATSTSILRQIGIAAEGEAPQRSTTPHPSARLGGLCRQPRLRRRGGAFALSLYASRSASRTSRWSS